MVDEKDFSVPKEDLSFKNKSVQSKNIDRKKLVDYVNRVQEEARNAVETGNLKSLDDLINEPLFSEDFPDQRSFFKKVQDTARQYVAIAKKSKFDVESGKYQAIKTQIEELESKKDLVKTYRQDYISAKNELIHQVSSYSMDLDVAVQDVSKLNSEKKDLEKIFTGDVINLLDGYFSGSLTKSDLKKEGLSIDVKSLQSYRVGLRELDRLNMEIDRKKSFLDKLNLEYEIAMDSKLMLDLDLVDLDLQEFYTSALINQLNVDLKLANKPSFSSFSAKLRSLRDKVYDVSEKVLNSDIDTRKSYNKSVTLAGSDNSFRKKYHSRQKDRPNLDL